MRFNYAPTTRINFITINSEITKILTFTDSTSITKKEKTEIKVEIGMNEYKAQYIK